MAAKIVRVLLICATSVIFSQIAAENANRLDIDIQFLVEPTNLVVERGKSAAFHCSVTHNAKEPVSIIWLHNGTQVVTAKGYRYVNSNGSLILHRVKKKWKNANNLSDSGVYQCLAKTSSAALISRPATLQIADISAFYRQPENVTTYEGEIVRLSCQLDSTPEAKITWTFQNQSINYELSKRHDATIPGVLYINNVQLSDTGEYRCVGVNPLSKNKEISEVGILTVNSGSNAVSNTVTFISPTYAAVKTIQENELLILECAVSGAQNVNIAWIYKNSESSAESLIVEVPQPYNVLKKPNINVDESGTYTCIVSRENFKLYLIRSVYVNVTTPPVIEVGPESKSLPLALSARFECKVRGKPQPVISWLHNGEPLKSEDLGSRIKQTENELFLMSTNLPDAGIYQCVATNEYGIAMAAANLFINDSLKPSSPINVRCSALNSTTIYVLWDIPDENESNKKPPIIIKDPDEDDNDPNVLNDDYVSSQTLSRIAYTVNYFPTDGGKEMVIPTTLKWTSINKLEPDEDYTFYVRTFNGASGSDPSEKVVCSTPSKEKSTEITLPSRTKMPWEISPKRGTPPLKPTNGPNLDVLQINETTYQVSWDFEKPIINNDEYKVECKKLDGSLVRSIKVNFEEKHAMLYDLASNSSYEVSLKIIINKTEGDIASKLIRPFTSTSMSTISPPTDIEIAIISSTSIRVSWTPPSEEDILYYSIKYAKLGAQKNISSSVLKSKNSEVVINNLEPGAAYSIQIETHDAGDRKSPYSVPVLAMLPQEDLVSVENISSEKLNSTSIRITWIDSKYGVSNDYSYFISYIPQVIGNTPIFNATRGANKYYVDITGLKPSTTYLVQIYLRNEDSPISVGSKSFTTLGESKSLPSHSSGFIKLFGVHLSNEQVVGVFIGVGISIILIILCIFVIFVCKRRFDKYYRGVSSGVRIVPSNEKHEMKVLTKNANGYRNQYENTCNQGKNIQLPLLSAANHHQLNNRRENCEYYDSNTKTAAEEVDKLLNTNSINDETSISAVDTTVNERDHEGGDSGYCDRNHTQSSLTKNCDNIQGLRKCSDITVDDGFYENELPDVSGTSPGKLNTVV